MSAKDKGSASPTAGQTRKERRAAERAARKSGSPRVSGTRSTRTVPLIAGGAIVIGLLLVVVLALAGGGFGSSLPAVTAADHAPPAQSLQTGRSLGNPDAPVKIDIYEDPQCPVCGEFTKRIEPLLIAGPVTAGQVFLTYKDMAFLGQESIDAAAAMRVAEGLDGKFWAYHDIVFHNQNGENKGAFTRSRLADMAVLVGLDRDAFLTALNDPQYQNAVEAETAAAQALGVSSTPTLDINGELNPGIPDWNGLKAKIDALAASG